MRTVKTNFKRPGKHFVAFMDHLSEAILVLAIRGLACMYNGMNGRFGKCRIRNPYAWRFLTWGTLVWAAFTYVFVPFFNWWDRVMTFLNYVIWG